MFAGIAFKALPGNRSHSNDKHKITKDAAASAGEKMVGGVSNDFAS